MKNISELVFSEALVEFPDRIQKMENKVLEFNKNLENMMLYNSGDDLSSLIKKRISEQIDNLSKNIKETNAWIQEYIDDLDVLGKGLINSKFSTISEFNEAKNIIDDDFR